jgi:hypothetical protein
VLIISHIIGTFRVFASPAYPRSLLLWRGAASFRFFHSILTEPTYIGHVVSREKSTATFCKDSVAVVVKREHTHLFFKDTNCRIQLILKRQEDLRSSCRDKRSTSSDTTSTIPFLSILQAVIK